MASTASNASGAQLTSNPVTAAATITDVAIVVGDGGSRGVKSTTTGTGVLTALAVNTGTDGAFVVKGGDAGTPSALVATNATGIAKNLTTGGNPVTFQLNFGMA